MAQAHQASPARPYRQQERQEARRAWLQALQELASLQAQSVQASALQVMEPPEPLRAHGQQAREQPGHGLGRSASRVWPQLAQAQPEPPDVLPLPSQQPLWPTLRQPLGQRFPEWLDEPSPLRQPGSSWNASSSR